MLKSRGWRRTSRGRRRWRYVLLLLFFSHPHPHPSSFFPSFLPSFLLRVFFFVFFLGVAPPVAFSFPFPRSFKTPTLTPPLLHVQTYTLEYTRTNLPHRGHIVGRLKSTGTRFLANHADAHTLAELGRWDREPIGRRGYVRRSSGGDGDEGRNVFTFGTGPRGRL